MEEFEVTVKGRTPKGLWLEFEELDKDTFIPDSQISNDSPIYMKSEDGETGTIIITTWIAGEKGLL